MEKSEKDEVESKGSSRRSRRERNDDTNNNDEKTTIAEVKGRRRRDVDSNDNNDSGQTGWMTVTLDANAKVDDDVERDNIHAANKDKHFQETDGDDIMVIPDLDDDGDNDHRVAHAPRNIARKIPTLTELESDVKSSIKNGEDGLDLTILLKALVPQSQLFEPDNTWTFENLLKEVTDELTGTQKSVIATITKELASGIKPVHKH